ncbi:MAG: hypothetical protein CYPHOPRED_003224 [Cyphobasidiales sp. Tagirdzhanova-0007]|nr:MAG: hypothetical protein CYPHOPRED_003224 [Cyphobasidiales sp. Tagirdzhanova-0007]
MMFSATIFAVLATAFVSAEAASANGKFGIVAGTNAQRLARGLPPKPINHADRRFKRALKPRTSAASIASTIATVGGTCDCTYDIYVSTLATYGSGEIIGTSQEADAADCYIYCDDNFYCISATYDATTMTCNIYNTPADSIAVSTSINSYINFDGPASGASCGAACAPA